MGEKKEAEKLYYESLEVSQCIDDPMVMGKVFWALGNMAMSKESLEEAFGNFEKARIIFQNYDSKINLIKIYLSFSDYFLKAGSMDESLNFAIKAEQEADKARLSGFRLPLTNQFYKIYSIREDKDKTIEYAHKLISLRDSLELIVQTKKPIHWEISRKLENQAFNLELIHQKQKFRFYLTAILISFGLLSLFSYLYYLWLLKKRRITLEKKRILENLNLRQKELALNTMGAIRRNNQIDEILSLIQELNADVNENSQKILIQRILKKLKSTKNSNLWNEFELRFKDLQTSFYNKLLSQYPNLSPNDLKLAAFLKLNLSSKDIAELTGRQVSTIEMGRSRLRGRLGIKNTKINLVGFINQIT